jgi:signal transduction histidine kinase
MQKLWSMTAQVATRTRATDFIPLRREPTDVIDLLSGAVEVLQGQARALDVNLSMEGRRDLPKVFIDPEKIAWAVTTLVGNALRHVRPGTRRLPGGTIRVRVDLAQSALLISVEDDGPGIPRDKVEHLFDRGNVRHGVGLALLMVRDVVAAHGGEVEIESSQGSFDGGTRILLRIPQA